MSAHRFSPSKVHKLESPERYKRFPPKDLLTTLGVKYGDKVLDLGAGSGYFAIPAAELTKNTVYALDIEVKMLDVLKEKMNTKQLTNIELVTGRVEQIPLEDESVDYVVASMILHEVDSLHEGLKEIHRVLKKGGRCLCLEWIKRESKQGPPIEHRIHHEDMREAIEKRGYHNVELSFPSGSVYQVLFEK